MPYNDADEQYNTLVRNVLRFGCPSDSRAGRTISTFGQKMMFDLREGFPLLTTKKINISSIYHELCWFLRGESNVNTLKAPQLWQPWAKENGDCGPIYGVQWRKWIGIKVENHDWRQRLLSYPFSVDQIANLLKDLKSNPASRRHVVSAWQAAELEDMSLSPCHAMFQCYVQNGCLDMQMYQRSGDIAIGVPFNIASYAILMHMIAQETGLTPRFFHHVLGDAHIYVNHIEKLKMQIEREPFEAPNLLLANKSLDDLAKADDPEDCVLVDYKSHPFVKYEVAV